MKFKFLTILILLILLPIIALGWMGSRLVENDEMVQAHQLQQLINAQLRESDQQIIGYFTELESVLLATPIFNITSTNINQAEIVMVRNHILETPYIDNIFILNAQGNLIFPNVNLASINEQTFIDKTKDLWGTMEAFRPTSPNDVQSIQQRRINAENANRSRFSVSGALSKIQRPQQQNTYAATESSIDTNELAESIEPLASANDSETSTDSIVSIESDKSSSSNATSIKSKSELGALQQRLEIENFVQEDNNTGHGWTVWRSGTESQIFFWFWNQNNQLTGLKLINPFWLNELTSRLSDNNDAENALDRARIELINEKQETLFDWQGLSHSESQSDLLGQRLLAPPLNGWRLAYFAPTHSDKTLQWLFYLAVLLLLGIVLAGLGFVIFREYRRDMHIAKQRVSFVNQVSHELKTPLTNICLYAELLDSESMKSSRDASIRKYSSILTQESQRLGRLINNILTFSSSQKQQQKLQFRSGNIDDTIKSTTKLFAPAFKSKNIKIQLELDASDTVDFDQNALEQILNNLLGNIEKYAFQGNLALIRSNQQNQITTIHVIDNGPGINAKLAERIFQPFYRIDNKINEGVSGTGIGLNIARDLCRLHGGDLRLNLKPQHGAHFIVSLKTPSSE